jgi:hypothetical protein
MAYKTPTERFVEWMHGRGGYYATLELKRYMDGEPFFKSDGGAEMSLRDFLAREDELVPRQPSLFK